MAALNDGTLSYSTFSSVHTNIEQGHGQDHPTEIFIRSLVKNKTGGTHAGKKRPNKYHITISYKTSNQAVPTQHRPGHVYTLGQTYETSQDYTYGWEKFWDMEDDDAAWGDKPTDRVQWPPKLADGGSFDAQTLAAP